MVITQEAPREKLACLGFVGHVPGPILLPLYTQPLHVNCLTLNKLLILLLVCCVSTLDAQLGERGGSTSPTIQLDKYLGSRDIDRDELRRRLEAKGIFVEDMTRQEVLKARPRIEAVIAEMEAEVAGRAGDTIAPLRPESQRELAGSITDGEDRDASDEEAVNDVTAEQAIDSQVISNIYGHQLFRNGSPRVYQATDNATPPDSYPLKPGDEIAVTIFGASQTDFILRLDQQGFVQLPNSLRIPLGGIELGNARALLTNRLRRFYTFGDGQISIQTQANRTITVSVFGEVESNGSFTMSSLNTGFDALVAAGGANRARVGT